MELLARELGQVSHLSQTGSALCPLNGTHWAPTKYMACTVLGPKVTAGDTVTAQSSGGSGSYSSVPEEGPEKQRALLAQSQGANLVPLQQYLLSASPGPVPGAGVPTPEAPIGSHL